MKTQPTALQRILRSRFFVMGYWVTGILFIILFVTDTFIMPWYVHQGGTMIVPSVIGLKEEEAIQKLESMNLQPRRGEVRPDNKYPEGYVVMQNPLPDQVVKSERRIYLTISGGEQLVVVPSLRGRTLRDSKFALDRSGLRQGGIQYKISAEFPEGTIITQDVIPGSKVRKGTYIGMMVSAGESIDSIFIPSLIGRTLTDAQRILREKGLKLGNITYQFNTELLPNTVIDQLPRENEVVTVKKEVDLFIVQAPQPGTTNREQQ
jgi:beta-lactam-binding protein with PASTA domain